MNNTFQVVTGSWGHFISELQSIRTQVFIDEQSVPVALEWDGYDETATHLIAYSDSNQAVATLRLLDDGHIGRVAVLKPYRHCGIATALLNKAEEIARERNYSELFLDSQIYICELYEKLGYKAEGTPFMDAGILHIRMHKTL